MNSDGSIEDISVSEGNLRIGENYAQEMYHPLASMFPILSSKGLLKQFRVNDSNFKTLKDVMKEILQESTDKDSVFNKIKEKELFSEDELLNDVILYITGGLEVHSSLTAAMFFIKFYPKVFAKVKKELEENGIRKGPGLRDSINSDSISKLDYLTCVLKEVNRFDPVTSDTFDYFVKQDLEICGVPLNKGTLIKIDILTAHYRSDSWLDPFTFEPDRFNPDSEFYAEAKKQGKNADLLSIRAFGLGVRECPGKNFGMIELKTIIAYLLVQLDYEIDETDLNMDAVGFSVGLGGKGAPLFNIL